MLLPCTQAGFYRSQTDLITPDNHHSDYDAIKHSHPYPFLNPSENKNDIGQIAHYQISETLGQGGMGYVFKAHDSQLHRTVALKVMKPELSHQINAKTRFLHEARSMASINSDNVAIIHQVGEENNTPFLAMEFLEGQPMDRWIQSHPSTPTETIIKWGIQICEGLIPAHAKNLIHRDIKPANLWIEAPDERIKLLDFGLAYALDSSDQLTQTGYILGTLEYMSPEQIEAGLIDTRSDLFSLGCVLYQLASNFSPFSGSSQLSVLKNIATITPLPLQQIRHDIPQSLSLLINQLLCKSPDARPASAHEVCLRLKKIAQQLDVNNGLDSLSNKRLATKTTLYSSSKTKSRYFIFSFFFISALLFFIFSSQSSTDTITPVSVSQVETNHLDNRSSAEASYEEDTVDSELTAIEDGYTINESKIEQMSLQESVEEPPTRPVRVANRGSLETYNPPYPRPMPPPEHHRPPHPPPGPFNKNGRPPGPPPRPPQR
ncbi:MAG: serine/threonine protein kinase [gamma proteobacterium symbiont of Bathyaustriella thionipta]|nr:serine/threonine protein kinase [gamma proteobacterium symbiont of Bathyaustriella thionipta]MCU7949947.1 serine/threonine protein kinase [gamma proteobacterium symbiont of Bathyaustriella thionipta]MCU7952644.1 serine/threonine protein kinase [gamma proteobacterium symbiont of Bathyaustriella thionipta]MCU7955862.1 serine/threonine protein kinase [gamma proteobacterium symbiont of Bathyaustriella thionipta]MCU7965784.1 serine/threonine protein kinase [gamma proteobacterium symbiont of Bathy